MLYKQKAIFIFLSIVLLLAGCTDILRRTIGGFAGSYPFVEYWEIKAPEEEILTAIRELNKEDVHFQPPANFNLMSERDTGYNWNSFEMREYLKKLETDSLTPLPEKNYGNYYHDYWVHIHLYYPDTKEMVRAWTRPSTEAGYTTFAFVSLVKEKGKPAERLINRDFRHNENKKQIIRFKTTFVEKILSRISSNRKKGMK